MKTRYEVHFVGTVSSNGPVFETTRKKEAIQHAKRAAIKHAGHPDFHHGWYEVFQTWPSACIFQSKTIFA